jgi:hypothetical protein
MKAPAVAFGGDLSLISLFDLGQLLRLNGATGCLAIRNGDRSGALYFEGGELVNAVDETCSEGENAAISLFAWRAGTFEFRAEAHVGERAIESGTEAIMMEAARRLDEAGAGPEDGSDDDDNSETRRLREHQLAMEALRDVFRRVAGEARQSHTGVDAMATTVQLFELSHHEDRLLYRPGHPPYMRRRGRWSPVPEPILDRSDYEELRARLLEACDPLAESSDPVRDRRMSLSDGRTLALGLVGDADAESLWLRPVGPTPPAPTALSGDIAGLTELLGLPEALLLVGASDLVTARRLLEATARLATGPSDTLVVVSRDGACRPTPEAGLTLHASPGGLRDTLDTVEPEIAALDPGLSRRDVSLDDLAAVPRVIAGIVGHEAAALPARWLSRMAPQPPAPSIAWLTGMLAGVVFARTTGNDPGTLTITSWPLEAGERGRALRGDFIGLNDRPAGRPRR